MENRPRLLSVAVIKPYNPEQPEEQRVYLAYTSWVTVHHERKLGEKLKAETWIPELK